MIMVLVMVLSMSVTAFAAGEPEPTPEPEYRLVSVSERYAGENWADFDYTFSYDNGGYLPSSYQRTQANYGSYTRAYTLSYDEAGRLVSERGQDVGFDGYQEYRYTYDGDGRLVKKELEYSNGSNGPTLDVTEYTYEGDGVFPSIERTITDQNGNVTTEAGEPEFLESEMRDLIYGKLYSLPFIGAGYNSNFGSFDIWLDDSVGRTIISSGIGNGVLAAEPQLTYDDNGYLIRADDGAGNYVELTYEPVA